MSKLYWVLAAGATTVMGAIAAPVRAQFDSCGVSLYSWLDLSEFPNAPGSGNSCWGYVSPSGEEYALMGLRNQMAVVRITDPANPVIVESIPHPNNIDSLWGDVRAYDHYAYVCTDQTGGGLQVIDLSQVDSNVVTVVRTVTESGLSRIHSLDINPESGHLYLAGSNLALGGTQGSLVAVSLADPANPVIAGQWSSAQGAHYTHEPHVISYTSGPYAGKEVAFCHNGGSGLTILDVTNKANMVPFGPDVTYAGLSYCHQGWTDPTRTYLYVNDELNNSLQTLVFNVSNLASPAFITTFSASVLTTDHNLYWRDGFLFESNYSSGLRIFDMTNPTAPVEVGYFDTYPENDAYAAPYTGAWNNHPFFPSGTVIVSDINRGLFILDVSDALAGKLLFSYPNAQPDLVSSAGGSLMRVNVAGAGGTSAQPDTGVLQFDRGAGHVAVPMQSVSSNVYDAVFPGSVCGSYVSFYVSAETTAGAVKNDPCTAPIPEYSALSGTGFGTPFFTDDFETAQGWTNGPDTAPRGAWVRGNPVATPQAQPGDDHTPPPGVNCMYTAANPAAQEGTNDVDDGTVRITSPAFDTGGNDALVTYWRWYFERDDGDDPADGFLAEISNDNGASWVTIEVLSPHGRGWERVQFFVGDLVVPTSQMKLRFSATDGILDADTIEAAIDDVFVAPLLCDPQDADIDADLDADLFDYALFSACYTGQGACACVPTLYDQAGQPECHAADLDMDGDVDPADYDLFDDGLTGP